MKNNLTKKIILSIALTMIGTATSQSPHSPISMSSEAKAYNISESETNVNELTKYYT
ncbi:TPA: superantigen-like protein, partial [Staphylococcus aureus]|nr:superantigen-like protein [Staphylococcus aureus]